MSAYPSLYLAGIRRQSTYRWGLLSSGIANVFFGVFRTAVFLTLFDQGRRVGGLDRADALTYVWVTQLLFDCIWTPWVWELPQSIRSGDFVVELVRPGDVFARLLCIDLGRATCSLLVRGLPQLVVAWIVLDLTLPSGGGLLVLAASVVLALGAGSAIRFLVALCAFWTPDYRGWYSVFFGIVYLLAGFPIPVELFPGAMRAIAEYGPLMTVLAAPVRVATGRAPLATLVLQAAWVVVALVGCRAALAIAQRRLVVHGG